MELETANLDFVSKKLKVNVREDDEKSSHNNRGNKRIVNKLEPHVKVIDKAESHDHNHEHSDGCCGHDHGGETSKKEIIKLAIGGLLFILPYLLKIRGNTKTNGLYSFLYYSRS